MLLALKEVVPAATIQGQYDALVAQTMAVITADMNRLVYVVVLGMVTLALGVRWHSRRPIRTTMGGSTHRSLRHALMITDTHVRT